MYRMFHCQTPLLLLASKRTCTSQKISVFKFKELSRAMPLCKV